MPTSDSTAQSNRSSGSDQLDGRGPGDGLPSSVEVAERAGRGPSRHMLEDTRRFWTKRAAEQVSEENAREAVRGVTDLFTLLAQWDQARGQTQEAELQRPSGSDIAQSTNAGRT